MDDVVCTKEYQTSNGKPRFECSALLRFSGGCRNLIDRT